MRLIAGILSLLFCFCWSADISEIVFVILSQDDEFHYALAKELQNSLQEQSNYINASKNRINVFISPKSFKVAADWTITQLIEPVLTVAPKSAKWVVFVEDRAKVALELLVKGLAKYNPHEEVWIGHQLQDTEPSIIHHFFFHEGLNFKYPNMGSGFAISVPLLERLKSLVHLKPLDFHIDPAHEFSLFVYNQGTGPLIQHEELFCSKVQPNCATYPAKFQPCGVADVDSVFFAVKTCGKFHTNRVKAVQKTWYRFANKKAFFSDLEDPSIPTISLKIPNTIQGHCQKTLAILQYAAKEFAENPKLQWLVLVDDDTILSVARISKLKTCFESESVPIVLGERYRFGAQSFDYPTGGAGTLINRQALSVLVEKCSCPRPDAPDDMVLGKCIQDVHIAFVHVPQMHQARPQDYAQGRLATDDAVTFHKHWMIDPVQVYKEWFLAEDQQLQVGPFRTEL